MPNPSPLPSKPSLDKLWFTRCPVPTATGLAYRLGWLQQAFADDGIAVETLQDNPGLGQHHYDHQLPELIREGGNILAFAARAQGAPTRLIGLTWIDEWQVILVRPESGIRSAADLAGKRLALPQWIEHPLPSHARGSSIARGMSLQGYRGVLASAGLGLHDVTLVEVPSGHGKRGQNGPRQLWAGIEQLAAGRVDAVYVKGAAAVDAARAAGVVVGIDLDALPSAHLRTNNGTPRPITVHKNLIDQHFDLLVRFLAETLRAADWAADNPDAVHAVLEGETAGSAAGVAAAYRNDFHRSLHPDLSAERLALFAEQKQALWLYGFLERDFDLHDWVDHRPLEAALALRERQRQAGL
ncbi:ABC transporter substrate-binding protein [Pseudomonas sp. ML96]|uniref:ABC transporter substrate-binding protein n=1 Tax=Pseudomonas sp. ML96 TaxID=1523503 RepID=UPI0005BB58F6|nr:ABC transporter substrate-binding protein [Pseudomonas sp. ML96]